MAITTTDGLIAAMTGAQEIQEQYFVSGTTVAAGMYLLPRLVVSGTGQMAIPTARGSGGHIPSSTLAGAVPYTGPSGGQEAYLTGISITGTVAGSYMWYDRVYAASGFSGTVATAQTITSPPTLTRPNSNGDGLQIWLEGYTAIGGTAAVVNVSYTNQAGVAGRTTVSENIIASMGSGRVQRLRLQAGDTGVRSIQSVTLANTTGTAGDFGVALYRPISAGMFSPFANGAVAASFSDLALPVIGTGAFLAPVLVATTTTSGISSHLLNIVRG